MKNETSSLDSANPRDSFHQHLHAYALAASAAGVTMLALAQSAQAEIIYTPANVTIGPNQSYPLDLNNDGVTDFTIVYESKANSASALNLFLQNPGGGNAVAGFLANTGGFQWAYAFYPGFLITKPTRHFISSSRATMAWARVKDGFSVWGGSWAGSSFGIGVYGRYLGLKFTISGKTHYGWAQLTTDFFYSKQVTLTGYAYETVPNKPIKTGQQQGGDKGVEQPDPASRPQPAHGQATLGALARGAQALPDWRGQKDQSLVSDAK